MTKIEKKRAGKPYRILKKYLINNQKIFDATLLIAQALRTVGSFMRLPLDLVMVILSYSSKSKYNSHASILKSIDYQVEAKDRAAKDLAFKNRYIEKFQAYKKFREERFIYRIKDLFFWADKKNRLRVADLYIEQLQTKTIAKMLNHDSYSLNRENFKPGFFSDKNLNLHCLLVDFEKDYVLLRQNTGRSQLENFRLTNANPLKFLKGSFHKI